MTSPLSDNVIMTNITNTSLVTSEAGGDVSPEERWRLLEQLNAENAVRVLPAAVFLGLVGVVGLVGNILVLLVFGRKFPPSTTRCFILGLAAVDLLTCVLSIPGGLVDLRFNYNFENVYLCRFVHFNNGFTSSASGLILLPMTVDRFRLVCRPLKPQMTTRVAVTSIVASVVFAFLIFLPNVVATGRATVETRWAGVQASVCTFSDEYKESPLIPAVLAIQVVAFFVAVFTVIVLYSIIGHAVWKRKRYRMKRTRQLNPVSYIGQTPLNDVNPQPPLSTSSGNDAAAAAQGSKTSGTGGKVEDSTDATSSTTSDDVAGEGSSQEAAQRSAADHLESEDRSGRLPGEETGGLESRCSSVKRLLCCCCCCTPCRRRSPPAASHSTVVQTSSSSSANDVSMIRMTFIMFLIVLVLVLAFIPFYVLMFIRLIDPGFVGRLDVLQSQVYNVFLRTYYLSAASNPFIYSAFNPRFRRECRNMCCRAP